MDWNLETIRFRFADFFRGFGRDGDVARTQNCDIMPLTDAPGINARRSMFSKKSPDEKSYRTLLKQAQKGDRDSAGMLAERQARFSFCRAWLAVQNQHDAQELAAEAVLRVQKEIAGIDDFKSYASKVISNLITDFIRKKRPQLSPFDGTEGTSPEPAGVVEVLEDDVDRQATLACLFMAIDELPSFDREVIRLRYFKKFKLADIASKHNCSVSKINQCLDRTISILRAKMIPNQGSYP